MKYSQFEGLYWLKLIESCWSNILILIFLKNDVWPNIVTLFWVQEKKCTIKYRVGKKVLILFYVLKLVLWKRTLNIFKSSPNFIIQNNAIFYIEGICSFDRISDFAINSKIFKLYDVVQLLYSKRDKTYAVGLK